MLESLPPARRINGPWMRVREEMVAFWAGGEVVRTGRDVGAFLDALRDERSIE
jgi:hypothetical protein